MSHKCTAHCASACFEPRFEVDQWHRFRLPRGWRASKFVGPYMAR